MAFQGDYNSTLDSNVALFWGDVYRMALPGFTIGPPVQDTAKQSLGIDRYITSPLGEVYAVEEKHRRSWYDDFALEHEHVYDDGRTVPGWMEKRLECDLLIYGMMSGPRRRATVFRYSEVKSAWDDNHVDWIKAAKAEVGGFAYKISKENYSYKTSNVCVPCETLIDLCPSAFSVEPPARKLWGPQAGEFSTTQVGKSHLKHNP